jgi:drug/metabolite transporter (DMT)-like permease
MIKNNTIKGYLLIMVTVLAMSNVYIFSKAALNVVNLAQFGFYWFGIALIFNYFINRKKLSPKTLKKISKKGYKQLIIIGLFELSGTTSFFLAVKTMTNPSIVSFLANLTPVFVLVLGITLLKEKFKGIEIFGIFLSITGSFIIAYNPGTEIRDDFFRAVILMLISSTAYSVSTILSKKNITEISPSVLTINRVVFLFTASVIFLIISGSSIIIESKALINITLGSFLGPYLATFTSYSALKYIEASRSSVLSSSKSVFVLITSFLYFNLFPGSFQILGGILTVSGVLLISLGSIYKLKKQTVTE